MKCEIFQDVCARWRARTRVCVCVCTYNNIYKVWNFVKPIIHFDYLI